MLRCDQVAAGVSPPAGRRTKIESSRVGQILMDKSETGRIQALPPEHGCVEDQPQQLRKTGLLEYA